jgi:hypothetical protein
MAEGGVEPVPAGPQRWRVSPPAGATGWVSLPIAYSPLWAARAAGGPLPFRRDQRGLLEVALVTPGSPVELEHRAGAAEWAGVALSLSAILLLAAGWWRLTRPRPNGR